MSGLIAIEGELNSAIQEYLEYIGFENTLEKFNEECLSNGKSIVNVERKPKTNQKTNIILNEMVQLFCHGERKEFFRRWLQNIPANIINDNIDTQKLEFDINIYFAIYPLRKGGKDAKTQYDENMGSFKTFIETRGRALSQNVDYLAYFALPYVPNVKDNPGYQRILSEEWSIELQNRLENFLSEALRIQQQPRLVSTYCNSTSKGSANNLQHQLLESEKRTMAYMKKFNKVQADYHNLIGITAELVDSLESSIRGQSVTSEYLQNICNRLFNSQLKQSIDFTRPGTAGDYIRQSLAYQKEKEKVSSPQLDYHKIKFDLKTADDRQKAILLQALRWRLTKSPAGEQRDKILESFISNDLFSISKPDNEKNDLVQLLRSDDEAVKQYMARMLNAFASLNKGRSYLASNINFIKVMEDVLSHEKEDTLCRQNLLAALQKLSLRRNLQTLMINDDIISWLLDLLEDTEVLSDYTLEYAVALLMNLCLRNTGKAKCTQDFKKTIKVLSDLLGNSNHEIRPYVNGALYSVLSVPSIRAYAKKIDLEDTLKTYLNDGNTEINTQIQFIINQINSNQESLISEPDNENEDNDDDDEEDQDAMETDLDKTEIIKTNPNNPNELFGENLLQTYNLNRENVKHSTVLSRPITPHQLRQSMRSLSPLKLANNPSDFKSKEKTIETNNTEKKSKTIETSDSKLDFQKKQKSTNNLKESTKNLSTQHIIPNKNNPSKIKASTNFRKTSDQYNKMMNENSTDVSKSKFDSSMSIGVDHTITNNNKQSIATINSVSTSNSIIPKFSPYEPSPRSVNSSRNSSSSGTINYSNVPDHFKKDNSKI